MSFPLSCSVVSTTLANESNDVTTGVMDSQGGRMVG